MKQKFVLLFISSFLFAFKPVDITGYKKLAVKTGNSFTVISDWQQTKLHLRDTIKEYQFKGSSLIERKAIILTSYGYLKPVKKWTASPVCDGDTITLITLKRPYE